MACAYVAFAVQIVCTFRHRPLTWCAHTIICTSRRTFRNRPLTWCAHTIICTSRRTFRNRPLTWRVTVALKIICTFISNFDTWCETILKVVRAPASFRLSSLQRVDRTDHLAALSAGASSTPSHCVAKPLAQLKEESNLDQSNLGSTVRWVFVS